MRSKVRDKNKSMAFDQESRGDIYPQKLTDNFDSIYKLLPCLQLFHAMLPLPLAAFLAIKFANNYCTVYVRFSTFL